MQVGFRCVAGVEGDLRCTRWRLVSTGRSCSTWGPHSAANHANLAVTWHHS